MAVLSRPRDIEQPTTLSTEVILAPAPPQSWVDTLAHAVSIVLSPPGLTTAMIALAAAASPGANAWFWAAIMLTLTVLGPIGYLLWLYRQGLVSDLDLQRREERTRPLMFTLAALALSAAILGFNPAPILLRSLAAAHLIQTTAVLAITLRWKISLHVAASAASVALLLYVTGPQAAPALAAIPLVAWSRIRLGRHTPAQTLAGAALGGLMTWGLLHWTMIIFAT